MEEYRLRNQKKLKCGITTGSCATVAAVAATRKLLLGENVRQISLLTPKGIKIEVPVIPDSYEENESATFFVVKESGDDPDVTNHIKVFAKVEKVKKEEVKDAFCFRDNQYPNLFLDGGSGVGRVTLEGLEQKVGQAAINKVPRAMIMEAVYEVCRLASEDVALKITIFVPEGEEIAKKTFNEKLGIKGGISILGTTGIVEPMSEKAIVDTIELEIKQRHNLGKTKLLISPGNYGQHYISKFLNMDFHKSIKCSNYLGETFDLAVLYGMEELLLVGNIGKLVKLAANIMNTHSKVADGRMEIFAVHTVLAGGTKDMAETIMQCINTEEVVSYLIQWNLLKPVMKRILDKIEDCVRRRVGEKMKFAVMVFSEQKGFLGGTSGYETMLESFQKSYE